MKASGGRPPGKKPWITWPDRLTKIKDKYGARGIAFSDRGGPFRDHHRAFLRGLGTPNYCNHDSSCARNIQHAAISLTGMGRKAVAYDLKHARHVVLQFRNIFEAVNIQEVSSLMHAMDHGCKLTVIDRPGPMCRPPRPTAICRSVPVPTMRSTWR